MKHSAEFPFGQGLPDAPLEMPKQQLESRRSIFRMLRDTLSVFTGR
jgi:hypothetical protein